MKGSKSSKVRKERKTTLEAGRISFGYKDTENDWISAYPVHFVKTQVHKMLAFLYVPDVGCHIAGIGKVAQCFRKILNCFDNVTYKDNFAA